MRLHLAMLVVVCCGCSLTTEVPDASGSGGQGGGGAGTAQGGSGAGGAGDGGAQQGAGGSTAAAGGDYFEDFESEAGPPGWDTSDPPTFFVSSGDAHQGVRSFQSQPVDHDDDARTEVTLEFVAPGVFAFWHRESTEPALDVVEFRVDDNEVAQFSGENDWSQHSVMIDTPGPHTFEWRYRKDEFFSDGEDSVWIDDVSATNAHLP